MLCCLETGVEGRLEEVKLQVETGLGLGHRVPVGGGAAWSGVDAAAVAVCGGVAPRLAQRGPQRSFLRLPSRHHQHPGPPTFGQDAAGLKLKGCPAGPVGWAELLAPLTGAQAP